MAKQQLEATKALSQQTIEELQERYRKLDKKKTEAETELRGANKRLEDLKKDAREKYGTDDIVELQKRLQEMTAENEEKRAKYQAQLDQIESDLAKVGREFAAAEAATGDTAKEP